MKLFVLLYCWYDGDSGLVDDSFMAVSSDTKELIRIAQHVHPDAVVHLPGQIVADDGMYGDARHRYRIVEVSTGELWLDRCGACYTTADDRMVSGINPERA